MPDSYYIGSENEIRQVKLEKWLLKGDGSVSSAALPDMSYDEIIALTHPQHVRVGLDLLTVAVDHENRNTGEPEIKAGPTVPGSNEFKAVQKAQKILTKVFADLRALLRSAAQHRSIQQKNLVARQLVLDEYNKRLATEAKTSGVLKDHLLKCKLFTVEALIRELEEYIDNQGLRVLHEALPQQDQLIHVQKVQEEHGSDEGAYFFKVPSGNIQSGTQASFEVPLVRIGQKGTRDKKGFEKAFTKAPAAPSQAPNEANHFEFARDTAHETVARILALQNAALPGNPTLQVASGVTETGIKRIRAILAIFCFNRMIGLGDQGSFRWDSRSHRFSDDKTRAPVLSTEKDKYGLLFKTSPDDLVRVALDANAKALLEQFSAHGSRQATLEEMCRKLIDRNPSSKGKAGAVKDVWATDMADFTVARLMPRAGRARYPGETALAYGARVDRDKDDGTDIASGKPLPIRIQPSGAITMVVEARSSNHRFSLLVATNPRVGVVNDSTAALQDLKHFQAV